VDNVPCMVAVSLKRFDEQLLKIESQVDFPSQLHLHKYGQQVPRHCVPRKIIAPGAIFLWSLPHVASRLTY
jgi:hypothetical protein